MSNATERAERKAYTVSRDKARAEHAALDMRDAASYVARFNATGRRGHFSRRR